MTESPASPSSSRYRLGTLGALTLVGPEDDIVLGKHGHHRRRLALLAVLAAAGEAGRSRDQLLLLFWPDASESRARHSLDQLLYALRGSIGESVFVGVNPVCLNPELVISDVGTFNAAIGRGDFEAAVDAYRGPFLDGFYLSDAPEFELWVERERSRLATRYAESLERLARNAEAARDHATAVRWWRKLTEADPLSNRNATGFMRALMDAGDHLAALQYAEQFEEIVAAELGTTAGPAVADLVTQARAQSRIKPDAASTPAASRVRSEPSTAQHSAAATSVAQQQPEPSRRRRVAARLIGSLVVVALLIVIATSLRRVGGTAPPAATEPSIAVLPLANVSRNPEDATIVDGIGEELIVTLAKIPGLRVIGRSSALLFKGSDASTQRIADSLGVSYLLDGSVQKTGSQLRVHVRVLSSHDGSTRWAETYVRELRDVFEVQDDIARAVAGELGLQLGVAKGTLLRRQPTRSVVAYELYLRGNDGTLLRSDSAARTGLEYFRQAVGLDSAYAAAWVGLGRMHMRLANSAGSPNRERYYALAEEFVRKALALDDSLAEGHAALGALRMISFDFPSAERQLARAIELDSSSSRPYEFMVTLDLWTDRPADALAHAQRAVALEPLSPSANAELANALVGNDRCDEALRTLETLSRLKPPLLRAIVLTALCQARRQRWTEAIAVLRPSAERGVPFTVGLFGYLLARSGNREEALRIEGKLLEQERLDGGVAFEIALVNAGLADFDTAVTWLERAIEDRSLIGAPSLSTTVAIMGPVFEDLRRHPRFENLRARLGLQKR